MSKEKARRRAEDRAKKNAPKPKPADKPTAALAKPRKKGPTRTAHQERQRRRLWVIGSIWLLANAVIWIVSGAGNWEAKWLGLTITTILIPLIVWLVWDPEGRVDL